MWYYGEASDGVGLRDKEVRMMKSQIVLLL
jgi:hypothetical protein